MSRSSTMGNLERAIPNSPFTIHKLNAGPPFKPEVNGLEDVVMKEN